MTKKPNTTLFDITELDSFLAANPKLKELFNLCENGITAIFEDDLVQVPFAQALPVIHGNIVAVANYFMNFSFQKYQPACKAGCNFCCHMRVAATPLELFIIARHLVETRTVEELRSLEALFSENIAKFKDRTSYEYSALKMPCAFLDNEGKCSIYEKRPLTCRRWVSHFREDCEKAFHSKDGRGNIRIDGESYVAGAGLEEGLVKRLNIMGLDNNHYELQSGLLWIFQTEDAEGKWIRKEPVFQGCIKSP
ncbi:MAG: YkgJ family cysteine cluster protein [Bdellovibrionales bacterium]